MTALAILQQTFRMLMNCVLYLDEVGKGAKQYDVDAHFR